MKALLIFLLVVMSLFEAALCVLGICVEIFFPKFYFCFFSFLVYLNFVHSIFKTFNLVRSVSNKNKFLVFL